MHFSGRGIIHPSLLPLVDEPVMELKFVAEAIRDHRDNGKGVRTSV